MVFDITWELGTKYREYIKSSHKQLYNTQTMTLGRIHWYIQKAETEYIKKAYKKKEEIKDGEYPYERTPFYEEVSEDEINWWLYKDNNYAELKIETEKALDHMQNLKNSLYNFMMKYPYNDTKDYPDFISKYNNFITQNIDDVDVFYNYVKWLHNNHVMAPLILWTDLWGTSRRNQRRIIIETDNIEGDMQVLMDCTERVLAVFWFYSYQHCADYPLIANLHNLNSYDSDYSIEAIDTLILVQTINFCLHEFYDYIIHLRDSLRLIIKKIDEFEIKNNRANQLLNSDTFWKRTIQNLQDAIVENQLFDFKTTIEYWHTKGNEKEKAGVDVCTQVAAFANSRGGVIIVGIGDKRPRRIVGVDDLENKMKNLSSLLNNYLSELDIVTIKPIEFSEEDSVKKQCILIIIPQTKKVISVKNDLNQPWYCYPIRSTTGLDKSNYFTIHKNKESVMQTNVNFLSDISLISGR